MRIIVLSLALALVTGSVASAAAGDVFFEGPPSAVAPLQAAIDDVRAANQALRDGNQADGMARLRAAAAALARAAGDARTYGASAESPSNATGVIETATAVGDYVDAHGDRRSARVAWRAAIRAFDRVYPARNVRERRAAALFAAHRYRAAFAAYAAWARSRGVSASVTDAEQTTFLAGLDAAAHGHWAQADTSLQTVVPSSSLYPDAAYARGWVVYALGRHEAARAAWRAASGSPRTGEQPGFSSLTIDAVRALAAS